MCAPQRGTTWNRRVGGVVDEAYVAREIAMTCHRLRAATIIAVLLAATAANAQTTPANPVIKNPNPASSEPTDESGLNPLARQGENSPTGQGPSLPTYPPPQSTVGAGPGNRGGEQQPKQNTPVPEE